MFFLNQTTEHRLPARLTAVCLMAAMVLFTACRERVKENYQIVEEGYKIFGENNPNLYGSDSQFDSTGSILYDRFGTTASYKGFFIVSSFLVEDPALILNYPQPFSYIDWTRMYSPERFKVTEIKNHSALHLVSYFINPPISPEKNRSAINGSYVLTDSNGDVYKQGRFNVLSSRDDFQLGKFNWSKESVPIEIHADEMLGNWTLETEFKDLVKGVNIRLTQKIKVLEKNQLPKLPKVEL